MHPAAPAAADTVVLSPAIPSWYTVPTAVPATVPTAVPATVPTAVPVTVPTAVPAIAHCRQQGIAGRAKVSAGAPHRRALGW